MNRTINDLKTRYQEATGEQMPYEIQRLSLDRIVRDVELVEAGNTVFVPKSAVAVAEETEGSMIEWDKRGEHT